MNRRTFLTLFSSLPFVGRLVPKPEPAWAVVRPGFKVRVARELLTMEQRPGHSVYVCPFGLPTLGHPECECKHHAIHRSYISGNLRDSGFSVSDWL